MARLPTGEDLGGPGSLVSGRPIATYDVSAVAKGAEAVGRGAQDLGNAAIGAGVQAMRKEERQAETLEEAQARAGIVMDMATLRAELPQATTDEGLEQSVRERAAAALEQRLAGVTDPRRRALLQEQYRPTVNETGIAAQSRAFSLRTDAEKAAAVQTLQNLRDTPDDGDPNMKTEIIRAGHGVIDGLENGGYIDRALAARQRQEWATGYAFDSLKKLPPVEIIAASRGGWEGALIRRESSGNPRVVNSLGYAGLYQFGAPLLQTLGLYTPGQNEDLKGWSKSPKDAPGKWSGTFAIPGFPGVRTLADFRESPEAQRAAFQASQTFYDGEIEKRGLGQFIGKTVQGVPITREGLYSMMHLGGVGGAEGALRRGENAKDANGSGVLDYARMAANAGPGDPLAGFLNREQRELLAKNTQDQVIDQDRKAQATRIQEASAQAETFERSILDANAGLRPMISRSSIESDPTLDEPRRNTLLRQYDSTTTGLRERAAAVEAFNSGALDGDPFNADKRKQIGLAYAQVVPSPSVLLQSDEAAERARVVTVEVAKRTGVVPEAVSNLVRGTLVATDPVRVERGLLVASRLMAANQHAFATVPGREQIEQAAAEFDYHLGIGRSAQEAAAIIAERNDPAWKAKLPGMRSNEAAAEFMKELKDENTINEARKRLATGILGFGRPDLAFDDRQMARINSDFQREALLEYQRTGNKDSATRLAMDRLVGDPSTGRRGIYAATNITGTPTIMKYAPEAAPGYPPVGGSKDYVADQYIEDVKALTGREIKRSDIVVVPTNAAAEQQMARAFNAGRPVPYVLGFKDEKGVLQALPMNGSVGFVADPDRARRALGERFSAEQARNRAAATAVPEPFGP
ncbi:hypothetical protein [Methylobacterium iners]|uniref:Uncharacterized protein n=1 Tax=Methylobacterium iners TaxID=418707 RepID=A0ABQ4RTM3_9HYPH|nr:hypothetical protein [Methylobacterium iners]GJD92937.1 hypothetical protein OCOJLMKI_0120 [Methylobacterium iners]